ncbi:MAG: adenosylcobinamide-GDP ribazoletransferase [Alphaproteobacteria bacterium]
MDDKAESDPDGPRAAWLARAMADLRVAMAFLTRVPVAMPPGDAPALADAMRMFPLVGAAIGLAGGVTYLAAAQIGLPALPGALLAVAAMVLMTGALHEDGLADAADGLGGGASPQRRLEIMRDSRTGVFGVLALVLAVGLRAAAITDLAVWSGGMPLLGALIAAGAWSRAVMVGVAANLPLADGGGLAVMAGRPAGGTAGAAAGVAVFLALLFVDLRAALVMLAVGALVGAGVALLARRRLGGYNGDVLGAVQQVAETAALLAVAAVL